MQHHIALRTDPTAFSHDDSSKNLHTKTAAASSPSTQSNTEESKTTGYRRTLASCRYRGEKQEGKVQENKVVSRSSDSS